MRKLIRGLCLALTVLLALTACASDGGSGSTDKAVGDNYPSKDMDWTIAFGPGGGNDIMSRTLADILKKQKLYPKNLVLQNREGGSGATGWGYLLNQKGDPYAISTTSGSFITTPLQADTGWTHKDFTPVGLFATDDALFITSPKSKITTWDQWVTFAKGEKSVAVGGIGTVNVDFIIHALLAEKAGYKIDYVPFDEEGQLQTALLSGSLDATVNNTGSILGQVEAKKVNPLLFTGAEPLSALPDVPTGESLGFTDLPTLPRGLILAPDAPDYATQWWTDTMKKVVATPEWKEYLETNFLTPNVKWGDEFGTFLEETANGFEKTLKEQGAL
jgi:putative tricarboxylic transport membrane protein